MAAPSPASDRPGQLARRSVAQLAGVQAAAGRWQVQYADWCQLAGLQDPAAGPPVRSPIGVVVRPRPPAATPAGQAS